MFTNGNQDLSLTRKQATAAFIHYRMKSVITPLHYLSYNEQLQKKCLILDNNLRRPANRLTKSCRNSPTSLIEHIKRCEGILFKLEDFRYAPLLDEFRNKSTYSVGKGYDLKDKTVGVILYNTKDLYLTGLFPVFGTRAIHYDVAKSFQEFIRASHYPGYEVVKDKSNDKSYEVSGYWSGILIRSTLNNEVMIAPALWTNDLTEKEKEKIKHEVVEYFLSTFRSKFNIKSIYIQFRKNMSPRHQFADFECIYGSPYIYETLLGYVFRISAASFFQLNTGGASVLYDTVREMAGFTKNTVLLDVCCGTGTIGIIMSKYVKRVIAIDELQESIEDAKYNAATNGIINITYHVSRAEHLLNKLLTDPDVLADGEDVIAILNPSRRGHSQKVTRAIRRCERIKKVIYISCKPDGHASSNFVELCMATCTKMPNTPFLPSRAVPVDMFPHTRHSELVLSFER